MNNLRYFFIFKLKILIFLKPNPKNEIVEPDSDDIKKKDGDDDGQDPQDGGDDDQ